LDNLGLGNWATQRERQAQVRAAHAERAATVDRIRLEVAEAYADSQARRLEAEAAQRQLDTAARAFQLDWQRSRNLEGRPIEVLNSANLLATARQDLVRAQVAFNQAQFVLFVGLGQPPAPWNAAK